MNALSKKQSWIRRQLPHRHALLPAIALFLTVFFSLPASAQDNIRIQGKVTDEGGTPVPGASISVKGLSIGTNADNQGNFTITAPANATLIISSVTFATQEVPVNNRQSITIKLATDTKTETEVIVVGYGTQRKEAVTGSVVSISGEKMRDVPAPNISQALQGRLPGVEIAQTSTKPGSNMQIRIRGTRSLSADNNPLVVLDGIPFPGSLADINPNDIKSIEILKDASATAIYGSRGANGVILITTDKGAKGRKARISYNGYFGLQTVFAKYPMMDGPSYVKLRNTAGLYSTPGLDEDENISTDWQDLFYRDGIVTDHSISLAGGTETGSYTFGAGYYKSQAVIPTQQYTRYSMRGSIDQQVGKYVRLGFTTNNNYNLSEGNQVGVGGVLGLSPIINPYNPDGSFKRTVRATMDESYVLTRDVVEKLGDLWVNETRGFATYNAIFGELKVPGVEGLKYRVNLGLDFIQNNGGNFTGEGVNSVNPTTVSTAGISNAQTYHWTVENILSYDRTFANKHTINFVGLYSAEQNKYNRSSMSARDIPAEDFQFYNLGQATGEKIIDPGGQSYQLWGLMSWMGRVMYSFDNRYMLSATLRSDGSSRLAPGHKWHTYPAISAGWNIANESFMQNVSFINSLKLRAGYGQTSNQAVNTYATLGLLSTRPYNFGPDDYAVGYYVTELPNPGLGWEYSKTVNLGLDFTLLNNRLSGTVEYYVTNTKDILLREGLPATSGVSSTMKNIGETRNKGIELNLNGIILDNVNGWTWEAGLNFYANRNEIVALSSGQTQDVGNAWFVGHNINAIYDFKKLGLWQDHDPYLTNLEGPGGKVGMIKVKYNGEYNDDGTPKRQIGSDDREVMDVDPDFQGGFNTRVAYKGFDLSLVAMFRSGGILISNLHGPAGYINKLTGRGNNMDVDYWTPENPGAKYPNPAGPLSNDNPKYSSTLAYFNGSFLKVRTISLGYNFSRSIIKNSDVKMRMYFTVQNPFVLFSPFHKESGLDPETNSYGDENVATGGYQRRLLTVGYNTPSTRNYVLGVNLNF